MDVATGWKLGGVTVSSQQGVLVMWEKGKTVSITTTKITKTIGRKRGGLWAAHGKCTGNKRKNNNNRKQVFRLKLLIVVVVSVVVAVAFVAAMKFSGIQNVISTKRTDKQKQTNRTTAAATKYYFSCLSSFLKPCGQQEIPLPLPSGSTHGRQPPTPKLSHLHMRVG